MWLGQQELGGVNEKDSDRERNHKVISKRSSHLPLPHWLEASPPLPLYLDAASPPLGFA